MTSGPPPFGSVGATVDVELLSTVVPLAGSAVLIMLEVLFIVAIWVVVAFMSGGRAVESSTVVA